MKMARVKQLSASQRMLLALDDAVKKLEAVENAKTEPIAIVGMSCRFPGGANNPEKYWQLLSDGVDAITEVPAERWHLDDHYDPNPDTAGKMYTRYGGFLDQVDQFDAQFFGISPREAVRIDPQQRLLLEVSWEALEKAGLIPNQLAVSQTGVFVGITTNDYARLLMPAGNLEQIDAYYLTGNPLNAVAGRLSYTLGLQGPCMAIDTACSSSLVAVHLACQSLRNEECDRALAGGVNLILSPENTIALSQAKMMAPNGRCKTFDAEADGIVRGEGCGVLVLKRLKDAVAEGDNILAVIRGSAVNQDGASSGFTVPNKSAQEALIRQALSRAKVEPSAVDYIEAHGTGTSLGDPIEVRALGAVLGKGRCATQPLLIGSVKTNIGHLESAAGVAGLIKVVLSLQHQQIPAHLHFQQPSPYINWDELPISVTTQATPWHRGEKPRIAGVSAFGASGTNAHVVLEEAPTQKIPESVDRPWHLLTVSAKSKEALEELAASYQQHLAANPALALGDICHTSNTGRGQFKHRLTVLASSTTDASAKLAAFCRGEEVPEILSGQARTKLPKIAFLFTGQGSQYVGMGKQLYEQSPVFRAEIDHCAQILDTQLDKSLLSVLDSSLIDQTAYTQPALFALEYALFQLWKSWGIVPSVVMGHSVGEYVAACVAGVFSLEDGLKLIAARGRLMQQLPQSGQMVAVMATLPEVEAALKPYEDQVTIAAINGPRSLVISGGTHIQLVVASLEAQGIKTKVLPVSHAFHSPLMMPMLSEFEKVAKEVTYSVPQIPLISNLTGQLVTEEIAHPEYWCRHILSPVHFASSMETLAQQGTEVFVEIGPKPILLGMGRQCIPDTGQQWLPSLRVGTGDWQQMLSCLAQLFVQGVAVDWQGVDRNYQRRGIALPTYPFQRQRYWVEAVKSDSTNSLAKSNRKANIHPLLGQRLHMAGSEEIRFESYISQNSPSFLGDHCVYQTAILPATAYIEMALAAGSAVYGDKLQLEQVTFQQVLVLSDTEQMLQVVLKPEATSYTFQIFSLTDETKEAIWTLHATGKIQLGDTNPNAGQIELSRLQSDYREEISVQDYYQSLSDRGFDYGANFQAITKIWQQAGGALGEVELPTGLTATEYQLHPVLLDACFQVLGTNFPDNGKQDVYLPMGVEKLQIHRRSGSRLWSRVQPLLSKDSNQQTANLWLYDDAGDLVASIFGLSFRRVSQKAFKRTMRKTLPSQPKDLNSLLYEIAWQPRAIEQPKSVEPGSWLIWSDNEIGEKLAQRLEERGDRCVRVSPGLYEQVHEDCYRIDSGKPEDFQRLLQDSFSGDNRLCLGIIYLASASETPIIEANLNICSSVLHLVQALTKAPLASAPQLWLVSEGTQTVTASPTQMQQASLWGLGRVIALEHPELRCVRLDLEPSAPDTEMSIISELLSSDREDQVAYRQGSRYVARLVRYRPESVKKSEPFQVKISAYGILENLQKAPMKRRPPAPGEVEVQVRAVGLNFRDVLNALGMLKEYTEQMGIAAATDLPFGGECAGTIVAVGEHVSDLKIGDQVIAAQTIGSLASFVTVPAEFVVIKPEELSFAEAATIPTTFLTAYYGLYRKAQIKAGDRVLIHAAAGGVGQAAMQLAQRAGAEVFATASPSKWEYLKSAGVEHVMNSRNLDFATEIMDITQGQGVDVVLNSLNGEYIPKSLEVLAKNGRFVEIGKIGIWDNSILHATRPDVAYFPFDLLDISMQDPSLIATLLKELMAEFKQGTLKPLPNKVFPIQDVVSAFKYMAQAKHIGKVIVTIPPTPTTELPPFSGSYLITGGLGALGLVVARWLVAQGARHIVLTGRRSVSTAVQQEIKEIEQAGAQVLVVTGDISQEEDVKRVLLAIAEHLPPLRGIIHAAGVLDDGMLAGQTQERFATVMAPKVAGAWNLHVLTQELTLDFFVCFSSVSALVGSPGQGNYAAANAFMDGLVNYRRSLGLPGLSINWGPWGDVGMAAGLAAHHRAQGMGTISTTVGLQALGEILDQDVSQVGVLPIDWSKFFGQFPPDVAFPFLQDFATRITVQPSEFRQKLEKATPRDRIPLLMTHVRSLIAKVLDLKSATDIDPQQGFADLGMDSLMAVELRNRLQTSLECSLSASLAFDYPTVEALVDYLAIEVVPISVESVVEEEKVVEPNLDHLSDSEAEALLMSKLDSMRY